VVAHGSWLFSSARNILSRCAVLPAPSLWFVQEDVLELKRELFIFRESAVLQECISMHDSLGAKVAYLFIPLPGFFLWEREKERIHL
jgi:hypothetical protein